MEISQSKPVGGFGLFVGGLIPKNREIDLDVVRGVAILLAIGWHLNRETGSAAFDALQMPGLVFGWAGVDLFFVLSGFLVGRLIFREHEKKGTFDYPRFFARRALKLWPILYIYLLFAALGSGEPWKSFVPQIGLHIQNFVVPSQAHHLWSLAVEEHFYLAAGLLLPIAMRRMSTNVVAFALASLIIFALIARIFGAAAGASASELQIQTQYRIDGLAAGVLLALIAVRCPDAMDRIIGKKRLWAILVIIGIVWLTVVPKDTWMGSTLGFTVSWATGTAFLLLVYRSGIVAWARWPSLALAFLGAYSYSLYIWHVAVAKIFGRFLAWMPGPIEIICTYLLVVFSAVVVTLAIERPILRIRDRWIESKS